MTTIQLSIFLENKTGRLNDVTKVLSKAGVNMRAFSVADNSDFGILRLLVDDTDKAKQVLARALQLCKDGKYAEGKQMLENLIAEDETAGQLSGHVQRIDDIIEIKAGRKPKAKIDASNTDNDLEVI